MKPWLASILVLLVLLCAAVAGSFWITGKCSRWQQELDEIAPLALDDPSSAVSPLQELAEQWQQTQFFLRMVASHQELDEIQLQLEKGYLTISAAKGLDKDQKDQQGRYIRRERYAGACSRSFYVGESVEPRDVSAAFEDGILKISLPKASPKELPESSTIAIG